MTWPWRSTATEAPGIGPADNAFVTMESICPAAAAVMSVGGHVSIRGANRRQPAATVQIVLTGFKQERSTSRHHISSRGMEISNQTQRDRVATRQGRGGVASS